jgi:hypothetical protein
MFFTNHWLWEKLPILTNWGKITNMAAAERLAEKNRVLQDLYSTCHEQAEVKFSGQSEKKMSFVVKGLSIITCEFKRILFCLYLPLNPISNLLMFIP